MSSLINVTNTVAGPFAGALTDSFGPRIVLALGSALIVGAYLLLSTTNALWAIFLTQGVMAGAGVGAIFVSVCLG